ncbi:MAG: hypothetical protein H6925_05890 [Holosporaceae bacterium]|nr:MAG: hypothetical protein H6925_05890 [Holosporaceae bacterium]
MTCVFVSTLLLCGVFHWTVLEQKFLDTKKYAAYLSLLLFFFLILVTAQSFFSFLLSLGGVSVVGYLVKTFMYEDVDSNRASFTHQILEFITLFFCMAGGFFSLKKPGLSGSSNIYYCLPVFFLILQKVDVVGFNFWRKEKKDVLSNFYFIFQKNFFLLTPIILYTFTHLMRFPEALKFGFMALGVFHLISACSHVFEGIEIRGVVESLYRFFGAIFLICIVRVKSVESAVLFLLFSSCVLVLLFLTNSAIEYFFPSR